MQVEEVKRGMLVVHRDSPIGKKQEHFYLIASVNQVIQSLVNRINELEQKLTNKK